jgi:hypothetical protein
MAQQDDADASYLRFGDEEGQFINNATVAILLEEVKRKSVEDQHSKNAPETVLSPAFESALAYAMRFRGAVQINDPAAIDEVIASLGALQFSRPLDDGGVEQLRMHLYEQVALTNLNPATVAAAKSLIPSLEKFSDDEVEEALKVLRRASSKYAE